MQRIGVDAIGVDRLALALRRSGPGFLKKAYTQAEIDYCAGSSERLAGRWAAKEAVIKCFDGTGHCFPRRRIEVLPAASGAPHVTLLGEAAGSGSWSPRASTRSWPPSAPRGWRHRLLRWRRARSATPPTRR